MDKTRAQQVLARIVDGRINGFYKDVVLLEQASVQEPKKTVKALLDAAGVTVTDFARFEGVLEAKFPDSRRKAYYLMSIHDHLHQIPTLEIESLGWSKALELAKVAKSEGRHFDSATWLHKAKEKTKQELKEEVYKYFTGGEYEEDVRKIVEI